jgi:hypothetical protein
MPRLYRRPDAGKHPQLPFPLSSGLASPIAPNPSDHRAEACLIFLVSDRTSSSHRSFRREKGGRFWPSGAPRTSRNCVRSGRIASRLRDMCSMRHQQPAGNLRMVTPRAESSPSNCATPGETSRPPGTTTAHSRFSRNSFDLISHWSKDDDFASPIWIIDQCLANANAVASSGEGPERMKWLFPCTRIPTI